MKEAAGMRKMTENKPNKIRQSCRSSESYNHVTVMDAIDQSCITRP